MVGGALYLDENSVTYKTNKLTVDKAYRNLVLPLDKIAEELEIELPLEDYDTFSGLIFDSFGSVPDDGEVFEIEIYSLHIKVEEIKNHMIKKTVVCKTLSE
jgi:putative hemolysin